MRVSSQGLLVLLLLLLLLAPCCSRHCYCYKLPAAAVLGVRPRHRLLPSQLLTSQALTSLFSYSLPKICSDCHLLCGPRHRVLELERGRLGRGGAAQGLPARLGVRLLGGFAHYGTIHVCFTLWRSCSRACCATGGAFWFGFTRSVDTYFLLHILMGCG